MSAVPQYDPAVHYHLDIHKALVAQLLPPSAPPANETNVGGIIQSIVNFVHLLLHPSLFQLRGADTRVVRRCERTEQTMGELRAAFTRMKMRPIHDRTEREKAQVRRTWKLWTIGLLGRIRFLSAN